MNFGYSVTDFIALVQLSWTVYKACKEAPQGFENISCEVLSLHAVLKEAEETVFLEPLGDSATKNLQVIGESCRDVLNDLQNLILKYQSLGTNSKRAWDRLRWAAKDVNALRTRLISNLTLFSTFISLSQFTVKKKLEALLHEYQDGKREGSIDSSLTADSLSPDEKGMWRSIRKELEDIGITVAAFDANRDFIIKWLVDAIATGAFQEQPQGDGSVFPAYSVLKEPVTPASLSDVTAMDSPLFDLGFGSSAKEECAVIDLGNPTRDLPNFSVDEMGGNIGLDVQEAPQEPPQTLWKAFAKLLEEVHPSDKRIIREYLLWLCFAKRRLTFDVLKEAVGLEESIATSEITQTTSPLHLALRRFLELSQRHLSVVGFDPYSMKEFLTSTTNHSPKVKYFILTPSNANKALMRKCLAYLCLDKFCYGYTFPQSLVRDRLEKDPLLAYAAEFWAIHAKSCNIDEEDLRLIQHFFSTKSLPRGGNFTVWVQILIPETDQSTIEATQPLYYAASFGLFQVTKSILESNPNLEIDAPGGRFGSTPLFAACWKQHHEVAELLLQAGADPNIMDISGCTVLSYAEEFATEPLKTIVKAHALQVKEAHRHGVLPLRLR